MIPPVDPMQLLYQRFGGPQQFQQAFNNAQAMVQQKCQELRMTPEQLANHMVQTGQLSQQALQNAQAMAQPVKQFFGIK